jgi:NAD(P)-dependent dehydrogenase (short-subunit alcohol dehydrogenase family)
VQAPDDRSRQPREDAGGEQRRERSACAIRPLLSDFVHGTQGETATGQHAIDRLYAEGQRPPFGTHCAEARDLAAKFGKSGGVWFRTAFVLGDLTVEDEAHSVANSAIKQLGGIDILVNNAGGPGDRLFWEETQIRAWAESYDRNVLVAVRLINHLLPSMRQSGWGRIVNVSSVAGVMPQPTGPDYGASKAAINNLSLSLTKALGASGVTVNTVSPGMILTPRLEKVLRQMATTNGWVASGAS